MQYEYSDRLENQKKTAEPMCLNRELFIITIIKIWQATLFPVDVPESNSKQNWWLNMV